MAAASAAAKLRLRLNEWSDRYRVAVTTESARHDHRYWIQIDFKDKKTLTLFLMTWNSDPDFMRPRLVKD